MPQCSQTPLTPFLAAAPCTSLHGTTYHPILICLYRYFSTRLSRFLNDSNKFRSLTAYEGAAWLHNAPAHHTVCLEAGSFANAKQDGILKVGYELRSSKSCSSNGEAAAVPSTTHEASSHHASTAEAATHEDVPSTAPPLP